MAVKGASPVTIIGENDPSTGIQYQIPLANITVDPSNSVTVVNWPSQMSTADQTLAQMVILDLVSRKLLTPAS
jgi:hypothetical protein